MGHGEHVPHDVGSDASREHLTRQRRLVLQPHAPARRAWSGLVALALGTAFVCAPLQGGFAAPPDSGGGRGAHLLAYPSHLALDVVLLLDVLASFRTSYQDDEHDVLVTAPRAIARRYVCAGVFGVDLLASLPLEWCLPAGSGWRPFVVLAKVLPRLPRLLAGLQADIDSNVDNLTLILTKLCCMLLLIWHWIACLYFRLFRDAAPADQAALGAEVSAEEAGWFREAGEPGWGPVALLSAPRLAQYGYALHWAIAATSQTMHPTPDTPEQQVFAVVAAVVGVLVVAVSVGAATTIIAELHAQASDVTARLGRIRRYMREKGVGRGLRGRVLAYYAFRFGAQQQLDDEAIGVGLKPRARARARARARCTRGPCSHAALQRT